MNKLGGGGGEWSSWVRELGQHLHLFFLWLFCVSAKFSNLFLCLQNPAHRRGKTVSPPMGGVTGPPFLNVPPSLSGPTVLQELTQGHGAQHGHDQTRRRMTARCLQPASDLGIQRHQKPSGLLSGPFLSMRRSKLVFEKVVSPKTGQ